MARQKHKIGDILNGWKITAGPERINGRVKYHFVCPDCGHDKGFLLTCNIQRLKKPCACKVGPPAPSFTPKYVKEDDGCFSVCHTGLAEHWHKLTHNDGLSQRKAAEMIHLTIMKHTDEGQHLEENFTPEKVRNIARTKTGKKSSYPSVKKVTSPKQLVEIVRQARKEIHTAMNFLQEMANTSKLSSGEEFRAMDVELEALRDLAIRFLPQKENPPVGS